MPTGLVTSSAAPVADQFLMVQSIAPPPNSIVAAFRTRWRPLVRFSSMAPATYTRIADGKMREFGFAPAFALLCDNLHEALPFIRMWPLAEPSPLPTISAA